MEWTASKSNLKARMDALNARLSERFRSIQIGQRMFFLLSDGTSLVALDYLGPYGALVTEFAADYDEAAANCLEDGDLYYLDEMDEDTMFQAMLQEFGE